MGDYGIKLNPSRSQYQLADEIDGCRLRINVTEWKGVSPKIFVYLTRPINPRQPSVLVADFHKVASSTDLETIPEDLPYENSNPPWFRLDYVDLVFPSNKQLEECLAAIKEDVSTLITTLTVIDRLNDGTDLVYGDLDGASSSSGV